MSSSAWTLRRRWRQRPPGLDPDGILLGFLWRIDSGPDGEAYAARLPDIVLDGLRPPPGRRRPAK